MGASASGARDANGFSAAVRERYLPPPSSLTYQGLFNQNAFMTGGPETLQEVSLAAHATRGTGVPCSFSTALPGADEVWVGCFLKSCRDGQPRDAMPIDVIVVLDISGSMDAAVAPGRHGGSRLSLAKAALTALLLRLREDDRFGLATFNRSGTVVQPLAFVRDLERETLGARIDELYANGGTTLAAGMDAAIGIREGAGSAGEAPRHKRLLFLTDMDDLSPGMLNEMIAAQAEMGCYVSFVGISSGFNAALAETVSKHRGCNYFCITRDQELQKVIVDDFAWNFFPAAFDVEVTQQSDTFDLAAVYGTPYDTTEEIMQTCWHPQTHKFYPADFKARAEALILCARKCSADLPTPAVQKILDFLSPATRSVIRVDTVFPSAVGSDGSVEGGLVLLRLRPRLEGVQSGVVRLMLRYTSAEGVQGSSCHDVRVLPPAPSGIVPAAPLESAVRKGVLLQRYVEVCKDFLSAAQRRADGSAPGARDMLLRVEALLAEFEASQEHVDEVCSGLREELRQFVEMAQSCLR